MRMYRLTVLGCVLAWFLIGLHWPAVHQLTHHGRSPSLTVMGVLLLLALAGLAGLWRLLRGSGLPARGHAS